MSHDGVFFIREQGKDTYFHDRYGGDTGPLLLRCRQGAWQKIQDLFPAAIKTERPDFSHPNHGAIFFDLDSHEILYWSDQFFYPPAFHRYFEDLIKLKWPKWTLRWAFQAVHDFAAALKVPPETLSPEHRAVRRVSLPEFVEAQESAWQRYQVKYREKPEELAKNLAELGEERLRFIIEDDHQSWVTVRRRDGKIADYNLSGYFCFPPSVVFAGQNILFEYLERRSPLSKVEGFFREEWGLGETLFIDEAAQELQWWWGRPGWSGAPVEDLWPGWKITYHNGGPAQHMVLTGRDPALVRCPAPAAFKIIRDALDREIVADEVISSVIQKFA